MTQPCHVTDAANLPWTRRNDCPMRTLPAGRLPTEHVATVSRLAIILTASHRYAARAIAPKCVRWRSSPLFGLVFSLSRAAPTARCSGPGAYRRSHVGVPPIRLDYLPGARAYVVAARPPGAKTRLRLRVRE